MEAVSYLVISKLVSASKVDDVIDNPAPNMLPGILSGNDKPNTGIRNPNCYASSLCKYSVSDQAPHFAIPNRIVPLVHSGSAYHDAGGYEGWKNQATIAPYLLYNAYGAVGTLIDVKNWDQNFVNPNTNIFNGAQPRNTK